jgi:hypothetical protein
MAIQGQERKGEVEGEREGAGEREEEQAIGKSTDLFTGRLTLLGPQTRCSSCLQFRDLGRFLTCEPCRRRNLKVKRRRALNTTHARNLNPPPTYTELANHIQRWQQATGKIERGFTGYRAITVNDYIREPTQEEEQELQDRQQRRENGKVERRVWEIEDKERIRELRAQRGQFLGEGEFEAWWEEREEMIKREREKQREVERGRREMKRDTERWVKLAVREDQERERKEREAKEQAYGPVEAQAYGLRERQAEIYIDDYYEFNDDY